jgi:AP-2 complex subunit mu-1
MKVNVKIRSCFSDKQFAMGVVMRIPVPKHTAGAVIKVTGGKAKYVAAQEAIVWKIKRFQGLTELTLAAGAYIRPLLSST